MHSFKRWCDRKNVKGDLRKLLMSTCCRMLTSETYEKVKYIFELICTVTLNRRKL